MAERVAFSKRQWSVLCLLGSVNFGASLCTSLQAPFFPREAEKKGASASEYGLVFGIYSAVIFVASPIFGKYINRTGGKRLLNAGVVLLGASVLCFGLLDMIDSHAAFISLGLTIRILEALGASAALTATLTIAACIFKDSMATSLAILKACFGLGNILGPTIGGYLFELGGFPCPFLSVGGFILAGAVVYFFALPDVDDDRNKDKAKAPLIGYLCDTRVDPKKLTILGSLLIIICFSLVGPAPFLPFETTLWVVCLGLMIHGLGYACILISSLIDAIRSAVKCGLPDDVNLYGIVSGLATSSFAIGDAMGSTVSGILYDTVGFRYGTLFVIAIHAAAIFAMTSLVCVDRHRAKNALNSASSLDDKGCVNLAASGSQETDTHALTSDGCAEGSDARELLTSTAECNAYGSIIKHADEMATFD